MTEETLFIEALEIPDAAERAAYLDRACAGDAALRARLERLLDEHGRAGSFLGNPAAGPLGVGNRAAPGGDPARTSAYAGPVEAAGTVIGPYKLLQQIGEGGMGTVFMAEQTDPIQRKVALKVIKASMDSHQVIARFEAERQALALMDHVNIARVLDAGTTAAGRPYFVMELVHGVPITKYCDDNQLTPRERLELFVPVCQAIQHAHQKGIIHRDVKPSNVLVTLYDGRPVPKVIDFGVAKATEQKLTERTLFTQYGGVVGTLEYMSPEQAEMSALGVDTRSDVFSLGVLLYELLTGSTPLSHERMKEAAYAEILRIIKEEEPPRPSTRLSASGAALASISAQRKTEPAQLSRLMRGELDWIVMKTLEKDRGRRYDTANGLADDVLRYLNDEPVQACPPSAAYRLRKFARRNKRLLATLGVLTLALVVGTAVSTWQAIRATQAEGLAESRLGIAQANHLLAEEAANQATRRLYEARLAQAQAGSLSRRVGQRFASLEAVADAAKIARDQKMPAERFLELRNAAIACLALPDLRLAKQWPGCPAGSASVDFDGDLKLYVRVNKQGAVSARRVADDQEIASLPGSGSETWLLLSRDGKFLAVWSGSRLNLWKLGGHDPVRVAQLDDAYGLDFSSDSRQLAVGRVGGPIRLYDLASGQPPRELSNGRRGGHLAFHPGGQRIAVSCANAVEVRDLDTGKVVADLKHEPQIKAYHLAWHPDGKTLAVACSDRLTYLWDVAAGKQKLVLEGMRNGGIHLAFNHAGDLLASTGWERKLRLWDPRTGQQLFSMPSGIDVPRFGPDDRLLAAENHRDGMLGLWEVAACREYRTLARAAVAGKAIYEITAIRSDGRLLAVAMQDGVGLWDLPSGKELAFIKSPGTYFVVFQPSGELLTSGTVGLLRWPVRADPGLLRIGPPHRQAISGPVGHLASSLDGRVIALSQFQGGQVLRAERPGQPVRLGPHDDARYVAVSPDGNLVATGSHTRTGVRIWDAVSGKLLKELPADGSRVGFSPDGKWLATTAGGTRLWAVGSWQPGPHLGGGNFAFSPDGKQLAVDTGYGAVRLVAPDTGREYARLEDPNQDRAFFMSFSPDGSQLVASNQDSQSVHVWNLRVIRKQLANMDLDWDLPPYAPPDPDAGQRLQVQVDLGDLGVLSQAHEHHRRAQGYVNSKQWDKAIGAYTQAIGLVPNSPRTLNELAWLLATCPNAKARDPGRALELAARAVNVTPLDGNAHNTLGVAHYRAGNWKAAVVAHTKSNDLLGGQELSFNAFFLAMAHWQQGRKEEARKWFDRAVEWMDKNKAQDEELRRFRTEAAELLGVGEKKG